MTNTEIFAGLCRLRAAYPSLPPDRRRHVYLELREIANGIEPTATSDPIDLLAFAMGTPLAILEGLEKAPMQ